MIRPNVQQRQGFTLVELLVVIAIIAVLISILLPAIQKAREAANNMACQNNVKQLCLAALNYETAFKRLPTPGEGLKIVNTGTTAAPVWSASKVYDTHSFFTYMLPYMEQKAIFDGMNLKFAYNDVAWPGNQLAARSDIPSFKCPSADGVERDPFNYGQTAYMPISYCDIDPATGDRASGTATGADGKLIKRQGALHVLGNVLNVYGGYGFDKTSLLTGTTFGTGGNIMGNVGDGTSNTIILGEDSSYRNHGSIFPYQLSSATDGVAASGVTATSADTGDLTTRSINRWAEPENGNGVSGPPQVDNTSGNPNKATQYAAGNGPKYQYVNQNASPLGGTSSGNGCLWSQNNCGPNDELFSAHPGGANVGFLDGHVQLLKGSVNFQTLRALMVPDDGPGVILDLNSAF